MRLIGGLLVILIGLIGCGDEPASKVMVTVENPVVECGSEPIVEYDSEIEKVYADLMKLLTPYEYSVLLQEVKKHCSQNLTDTHVLRRLEDELSPASYEVLLKPSRIPKWTRTTLNRIKLAAHLKNAIAVTRITGKIIYVFDFQNTVIVKQSKSGFPDHYVVRAEEFYGVRTYNPLVHEVANEIETLNATETDKPLPIVLPDVIPEGIDIVVLDEFANPIPPTPDWYYKWIFDYADAPRATNEEISTTNYIETPLAFDCLEDERNN